MNEIADSEQLMAVECADKLHEILDKCNGFVAIEALIILLRGRSGIAQHIANEVRAKEEF